MLCKAVIVTFGASVNHRLQAIWVLHIHHIDQCRINPTPGFYAVQATYHHLKLHVEVLVKVLDPTVVRCDLDTLHTPLDEPRRNLRLGLADVCLPEQELSVEVRNVDRVHVDDVDVLESRERKVLEDLTAQAAGSNDQDPDAIHPGHHRVGVISGLLARVCERAWHCAYFVEVEPMKVWISEDGYQPPRLVTRHFEDPSARDWTSAAAIVEETRRDSACCGVNQTELTNLTEGSFGGVLAVEVGLTYRRPIRLQRHSGNTGGVVCCHSTWWRDRTVPKISVPVPDSLLESLEKAGLHKHPNYLRSLAKAI